MLRWLILVSGISVNAAASVLIKYAVTPPRPLPSLSHPFAVFGNVPLLAGVVLYGVAFLLYALALTKLPLNVAHPILTSGAIAMVAVCSKVLFQENMSYVKLLGIVVIVVGVFLVAYEE